MPDFARAESPDLFSTAAFGKFYDKRLIATAEATSGGGGGGGGVTTLRFRTVWLLKMPIIVTLVLIATVEPGQYFVDQMIPGEWGWWDTRLWYYPLTILPLPWAWWHVWKVSRDAAHDHAHEMIGKIREEIGAEVIGDDSGRGAHS
jgi:hypothetical protein